MKRINRMFKKLTVTIAAVFIATLLIINCLPLMAAAGSGRSVAREEAAAAGGRVAEKGVAAEKGVVAEKGAVAESGGAAARERAAGGGDLEVIPAPREAVMTGKFTDAGAAERWGVLGGSGRGECCGNGREGKDGSGRGDCCGKGREGKDGSGRGECCGNGREGKDGSGRGECCGKGREGREGRCRVKFSTKLPEEGYVLKVTKRGVRVKAGSEAGAFYARQTLAQEAEAYGGRLKCGVVKDAPRFAWRGYMLDESRHFFGEEYVLKTLDLMAYYKLNKFHWHLTDSPGWRIEIKKYPGLTETGAIGNHTDPDAPAQFYTQEQIRRIIAYAAERHIEVIPEFDMPGHASSASRSYPYLSAGDNGFTFNIGREETYTFISDVLDEIFALFPSRYIHIGGDEVSFGSSCWNDNPDIQSLMQREGLKDLKAAEGWFLARIAEMVKEKGHTLIAWDDVFDTGGIPAAADGGAVLMWWRQERPDHLTEALDSGMGTILCPRLPLYLDFVQYPGHTQGRCNWGRDAVCCTVEDIYNFPETNVSGVEFSPERLASVIGIQGNLWSETVKTAERADHMTWPRLCAIAESAWTLPERKDFASFEARMDAAFAHLERCGVHFFDYRDPERHPEIPVAQRAITND